MTMVYIAQHGVRNPASQHDEMLTTPCSLTRTFRGTVLVLLAKLSSTAAPIGDGKRDGKQDRQSLDASCGSYIAVL
jgi:hypothetical protein